jgi:hypothetical protein
MSAPDLRALRFKLPQRPASGWSFIEIAALRSGSEFAIGRSARQADVLTIVNADETSGAGRMAWIQSSQKALAAASFQKLPLR